MAFNYTRTKPLRITNGSEYTSDAFSGEIAEFSKADICLTGFSNIDGFQPLYLGLYVIGGAPSVGKTTFVHQLADQIAANGKTVLYFSCSETRLELVSKSIARECYLSRDELHFKDRLPSGLEIRSGWSAFRPELFDELVKRYSAKIENRFVIVDGVHSIGMNNVVTTTHSACEAGVTPVVIIDNLQGIAALDDVEEVVRRLKKLQSKFNLTMIVVSNIDRASYGSEVSLESFKEAGGIELVADVVFGMNSSTEVPVSDEAEAEGLSRVRRVTLTCLKNRFGLKGERCMFEYYPTVDDFKVRQ